jgi:SAM-dependent methyltransferase
MGTAAFVMGRGSHPLARPATVNHVPPSPLEHASYPYAAAFTPHSSSYVRPVLLSYLADVPAGARVLDLGCGTGELLAALKDRQWIRTGLDISATGIAEGRRSHPDITFIEADATGDLSGHIAPGSFDVVVSTETLEHVTLPRLFLKNAYQALKPGGRLVLSVPYNGYVKQLAVAVLGRTDGYYNPLWDWGHIKFYSVDTMSTLLWEAGFDDLEYQGAGRVPYLWKSMVFVARKPATGH